MYSAANNSFSYNFKYKDVGVTWRISSILLEHIPFHHDNLIFCCIGTDRSTGDSLGPLTGSLLTGFSNFPYQVVGTLENPLHALNLEETHNRIQQLSPKPFVIAIDACLGESRKIGDILIHEGPLWPGKAVKKELPPIGDVSIKGIVNIGGFLEYAVLQNTRLHTTYEMSHQIARATLLAAQRYSLKLKHNSDGYTDNQYSWQQVSHSYLSQSD